MASVKRRKHAAPMVGLNVLGLAIRKVRRSLTPKVSQDDLAGRVSALGIHMDQTTVAKIENGTRYLCDFEAITIAKALKTPFQRLIDEIKVR